MIFLPTSDSYLLPLVLSCPLPCSWSSSSRCFFCLPASPNVGGNRFGSGRAKAVHGHVLEHHVAKRCNAPQRLRARCGRIESGKINFIHISAEGFDVGGGQPIPVIASQKHDGDLRVRPAVQALLLRRDGGGGGGRGGASTAALWSRRRGGRGVVWRGKLCVMIVLIVVCRSKKPLTSGGLHAGGASA